MVSITMMMRPNKKKARKRLKKVLIIIQILRIRLMPNNYSLSLENLNLRHLTVVVGVILETNFS